MVVRGVPWWGVLSSAAAPVFLACGWVIAARLQPGSFDSVARTISSLAARGATDRWVMTLALIMVGACDVLTGLALRPVAAAGRIILVAGGIAGLLVAASPETAGAPGSLAHMLWATAGFVALTTWPLGSSRRGASVPCGLRPAVGGIAAAVMAALLIWFGAELIGGLGAAGLAERILGEVQALWPLVVVLSIRAAGQASDPAAAPAGRA